MFKILLSLDPFFLAICAGLFTFLLTALGSAVVFFFKNINDKVLVIMLGCSSGVMIAASFWSLLEPAIELNSSISNQTYLIPTIGFILGGALIIISDILFSKLTKNSTNQRNTLIVASVSLHNLPEGLAIGVAFGALSLLTYNEGNVINALLLAFGIGIQNLPEGSCISLPLKESNLSSFKSFLIGSLSGILELIGVLLGFIFSNITTLLLPFLLSFSAGCMIAVSASELIPDAFSKNKTLACVGLIFGFSLMMALDVGLS